jgi:hypothetical protein
MNLFDDVVLRLAGLVLMYLLGYHRGARIERIRRIRIIERSVRAQREVR